MKQYSSSVYQDETTGKYASIAVDGGVNLVDSIYDASELYGLTWNMVRFENDGDAHFVPIDIIVERVIKIQT